MQQSTQVRTLAELYNRRLRAALEVANAFVGVGSALAKQAEADHAIGMAVIAGMVGSAMDVLAGDVQAAAGVPSTAVGFTFPLDYVDAANISLGVGVGMGASLNGIKTTIENIPGVGLDLTFVELGLNNVTSKSVSAFAACVRLREGQEREETVVYIRYKGGGLYRYFPLAFQCWVELVTILRQMSQGLSVALTIGEYVERVIKRAHESGLALCEQFDPASNAWIVTLTRTQKLAAKQGHDAAEALFGTDPIPATPSTSGTEASADVDPMPTGLATEAPEPQPVPEPAPELTPTEEIPSSQEAPPEVSAALEPTGESGAIPTPSLSAGLGDEAQL